MKVYFNGGLHVFLDGVHLLFDPTSVFASDQYPVMVNEAPVDAIFVSHAHADHCNAFGNYSGKGIPCILHEATMEILSIHAPVDNPILVKEGDNISVKGMDVEAFWAGHCLGSLQFRVTFSGGTFVYTGDFNLEGSITMKKPKIVKGDYLAIETTLGDPEMVHEYIEGMYMDIQDFVHGAFKRNEKIVVIYGYPLGTAQEIVMLFNNVERRKYNVFVDDTPYEMNKLYEKHVALLGRYKKWNGKVTVGKKLLFANLAWVKYGNTFGKRFNTREPPSIVIAGRKFDGFNHFNLPFHSDFNGLKRYVVESGAKKVFPFHGQHVPFTKKMRECGHDVTDPHEERYDEN